MTSDSRDRSTAALEELHQRLRESVERLESGDQWQAWLQERFPMPAEPAAALL